MVELPNKVLILLSIKPTTFLKKNTNAQKNPEAIETSQIAEGITIHKTTETKTTGPKKDLMIVLEEKAMIDPLEDSMIDPLEDLMIDPPEERMMIEDQEKRAIIDQGSTKVINQFEIEITIHIKKEKTITGNTIEISIETMGAGIKIEEKIIPAIDHPEENKLSDMNLKDNNSGKGLQFSGLRSRTSVLEMIGSILSSRYSLF